MYASLRSLARRIIAENKWRKYSKKWGYVKGMRNLNKYFRLHLFVSLCLSSTFTVGHANGLLGDGCSTPSPVGSTPIDVTRMPFGSEATHDPIGIPKSL